MNDKTNLVSVIIPVYIGTKVSAFRKSLSSLIKQSRKPDELVVVVDGRLSDGLWKYITKVLDSGILPFPIVLVCCLKNSGPGYARNLGAMVASSKWLAVHDSDDSYCESRLALQAEHLGETVDVVGAFIEEKHTYSNPPYINVRRVPEGDRDIKRELSLYSTVNNATAIIKKDTFLSVGGYPNLRFGEDYILWQRIKKAGGKFVNIPKVVMTVEVDEDFFLRRRGLSLLRKEVQYISLMYKEQYISLPRYLVKLVRSTTLRVLPRFALKFLYRVGR